MARGYVALAVLLVVAFFGIGLLVRWELAIVTAVLLVVGAGLAWHAPARRPRSVEEGAELHALKEEDDRHHTYLNLR